ncbi:Glyoxylase, beta-lactamase superfamily II [Microlunatus sagamiharensis]|uniref:Glyoxylase, beta-lactamase superfamily II n=1 Tax=Microlunatus sagamiharensis TaxID=546874 RepID=A0A1H2M7W7_9ACTN|nr:MBL fold metallo-hydrolase [Microlunatus sagamiharensis]SDU88991.1 Glyoxylase, beta-lactamase superfamily II [Microlunatus sagamiharensis]
MFIASFPAGPWQTSCYVLATSSRAECVVVDPGMGALDGVRDVVAEHHLKPVAAVLTHGHLDHMFSVAPLCAGYDATCWVHPDDRHLLADPLAGMSEDTEALLARLGGAGTAFTEPDDVRLLVDGATVEVAGLALDALHAPGHTAGSTMFRCDYPPEPDVDSLLFAGDVLFAGSVGRTDLPGGDPTAMARSLRDKVLPLPDGVVVLPGHGPQTTMAAERARNPYLQPSYLEEVLA